MSLHHISFLRARSDRQTADFHAWLLAEIGNEFQSHSEPGESCVLSLGEPPPSGFALPPGLRMDASNSRPWPPYDAALICHGAERAGLLPKIEEWVDLDHTYRVTRTVIKDDRQITGHSPVQGIKYLRGLIFYDDLPESAIRRSWARHAPLAVDVHVGASRYVQWWVEERLSPDAPGIGGIAELHFADERTLIEGFVDSARGMKEIVQDTGHFIAGGPPRLFARDYLFGAQADA